jgi:hypothetical protein
MSHHHAHHHVHHALRMHRLVRPAIYAGGKRPSFQAAYARAARRYKFGVGRFPIYAFKNDLVYRVRSLDASGSGNEVPADDIQNDTEYVVPVKIGTPGVTLNLDFDTGSSDLWVWSSELTNPSSGHTIYNPANSSTAKQAAGTWNISYGDGSSASGNIYTDAVTVANVTIPNQAVELAEKLSSSFLQDGGSDGLLGLAWPSINTVTPNPVATPVENMINENLINPQVFTAKLDRGDNAGFYSFGYIDPTVTSDALTYTPVDNSQGFWSVPSASISLNGQTVARAGNTAILDTGTTLLLIDDTILEQIYGTIQGATFDQSQGGWKYPENATVPDVQFAVGNQLYQLNSADFAFGPADTGYLFGGIQSRGDQNFDIFGDVFLKSVYVVFNQGDTTVGLAQRTD